MKDMNGKIIKDGDLMAEVTGGGGFGGVSYSCVSIWEVPKIKDGRGTWYTEKGKQSFFYWADASNSQQLDINKLPEGFLFAFKHGLHRIDIEDQYMKLDIHEAIKKSDWQRKAITPEILEQLNSMSKIKINSFLDVYNQWDSIFSIDRVAPEVIAQIMNIVGYKKCIPKNGEIGIAALYDYSAFMNVYNNLSAWKNEGVLYDKCKELDGKITS